MKHFPVLLIGCALLGCTKVRPNIQAGDQTPENFPRLVEVACPTSLASQTLQPQQGELGGIAAILVSAAITAGVDLLGSKLKSASEEKKLTYEAQRNFTDVPTEGCFDFQKGTNSFRFAIVPAQDAKFLSFRMLSSNYAETVGGGDKGVRGLALTFEMLKPGMAEPVTQAISLQNVEVGSNVTFPEQKTKTEQPLESAYIANPFFRPETDDELKERQKISRDAKRRLEKDLPVTLRVRLTEVRNANEFYKFGGDVVEASNDDLTAALIKAFGIGNDDEEDTSTNQESEAQRREEQP